MPAPRRAIRRTDRLRRDRRQNWHAPRSLDERWFRIDEQNTAKPVFAAMRALLPFVILVSACVSTGTYNSKVADLTKARDDDAAAAKQRQHALDEQILELQSKLADTQAALDKTTADKEALQKQLDDGTVLVATLKQRLEKLGQNVDSLAKEKGQLTQAMTDATTRLDELRKQKAAAEARAQTFRNLIAKLRSMIDSGQLKVAIRGGRMLIALPNDILFDSGQTAVKPDGKAALAKVAQVLATVGDRDFLVAGHTDNVPIRTALFPSNWELSTRRAVEVVHILVAQGMNPKVLAAAGYGEFDPAAANDTAEHRAQNRRIEIVLQPNLSDLPPLDDATATTAGNESKK
jgi:chemotaxis protein MotB